jgi:RNA ligase
MKSLSKETLMHYCELGLIGVKRHPTLPLSIYNYTRKCQYEAAWDEVTLQCRGLIMDDAGQIVARGFNKFFNYEELERKGAVPTGGNRAWIQKKMDGSLGILFNYRGEWIMATRGSFESDQAIAGLRIARERYDLSRFKPTATYLCEIIYPENRIVVDYGGETRLVFISAIRAGLELEWLSARNLFVISCIEPEDIVETVSVEGFSLAQYAELKAQQAENEEGFVIRFEPSGERVKIKFEEYVRLHNIMFGLSNTDIWEVLSRGESVESLLDSVPDEMDAWIRAQAEDLTRQYWNRFRQGVALAGEAVSLHAGSRKEMALWLKRTAEPHLQSLAFAIFDDKGVERLIWKQIKPVRRTWCQNPEDRE